MPSKVQAYRNLAWPQHQERKALNKQAKKKSMLELNLLNSSNHKMASRFYLVGEVQLIVAGCLGSVLELLKWGVRAIDVCHGCGSGQ